MKYLYDICMGSGLVTVSVGVGIQFGYPWGMMLFGGVLVILSVFLSILPSVVKPNAIKPN